MFFPWATFQGVQPFDPSPYNTSQNRTACEGPKMSHGMDLPG
jgi:hypothetical protein